MSDSLVETIKVKELNIDLIDPNDRSVHEDKKGFRLVMIGKPGVGKSNMIKYLLYMKKHLIPVGFCMSGSEGLNNDFKKYIPSLMVYNEYEEESLEDAIKRQTLAIKHLENP